MLSKYFSGFQTEILFVFPLDTPDIWIQTQRIASEQGRNAEIEEAFGALLDQTESSEATSWQTSAPVETRQEGREQPGPRLCLQKTETDHRLPGAPEIHQAGLQPTPSPAGTFR